jgi:hypothetical protein
MVLANGIWKASITQLYYGSKVIYSLVVEDTIGNIVDLRDSTYIDFIMLGKFDTIISGTDAAANYYTPMSMSENYSWSRQIYLYSEVCPDLSSAGTYITDIAWESIGASAVYTNQSCFMRAIDDSVETISYFDPYGNGLTPVWTGTLVILPGWVEIILDVPFFLPAGKNLEIIWEDYSRTFTNNAHTWAHSSTSPVNRTVYAQNAASFPFSNGTLEMNRPNIKFAKEPPFDPYFGNNLALLYCPTPVNIEEEMCEPDYSTVSVVLANLGTRNYDFSIDTIGIRWKVTNPHQTVYTGYLPVQTGTLASARETIFELTSTLPIMYAGTYEIKVWIENSHDRIIYDDTIVYLYASGRIGLPVDDNFSNSVLSPTFVTTPLIGTDNWETYSDPSSPVQPDFGTGMLRYVGEYGTMAQLNIRQLDLNGSINPKLEFWYYHDITAPVMDRSYTDINILADGALTRVLSVFRKDTAIGWKKYTIDLTPYTGNECVLVEFIATNRFGATSIQYIDRITILSTPDLAVSEIVISPEISICDLDNKDLSVVLNTIVNQRIDFAASGDSLAVEVPGYSTFKVPLQGYIVGNSSRTVPIGNINIPPGRNVIKAYLTSPVDNYSYNDTAYYNLDIRPELSITVNSMTTGQNCFKIGNDVQQEITLKNTGNMDIMNISLTLQIDTGETGSPSYAIFTEIYTDTIHAGDSIPNYRFAGIYKAPASAIYYVRVSAYMICNSLLVNDITETTECSDIHDISIIQLDNPNTQTDVVGSSENVTVSIANTSDVQNYSNVSILLFIEDEDGVVLSSRFGTISEIQPSSTKQFTFAEAYTVPDNPTYYIRVYLNSVDNYPENDSLLVQRTTTTVSVNTMEKMNSFTLEQNIPNPANKSTRINYSIPEDGNVVFHLHSISGQLLYSETIETTIGKHNLELNTSKLSSGIYFYSIEYKGQRLIKRMMINN